MRFAIKQMLSNANIHLGKKIIIITNNNDKLQRMEKTNQQFFSCKNNWTRQ